jgi:transcriptional regulator with XRE-family HTH domain
MDPRQILAVNIRLLRYERRLSQEALAHEAGVDRSYMSKIERGGTYAGLEIIAKLADILGVEPHEMLMPPPSRKTGETRN